jgi:hypothetical protein
MTKEPGAMPGLFRFRQLIAWPVAFEALEEWLATYAASAVLRRRQEQDAPHPDV